MSLTRAKDNTYTVIDYGKVPLGVIDYESSHTLYTSRGHVVYLAPNELTIEAINRDNSNLN